MLEYNNPPTNKHELSLSLSHTHTHTHTHAHTHTECLRDTESKIELNETETIEQRNSGIKFERKT